ncbi:MAG: hypothetical protein JWM33_223 [Caulobacteraceae bacterium]|nr:hypothetical protein [Caulobacteraceae bacterium]
MSFLLDTNAVSEPKRMRPNPGYMEWFSARSADSLFVSVLALGEIRLGVMALPENAHRASLESWLAMASLMFSDRILPIDEAVTRVWTQVALRHKQARLKIGLADELIAATAITHDLTLVSHNRRDFEASGCRLITPWSAHL